MHERAAQLLDDVRVERIGPDGPEVRYRARLSEAWNFFMPSGGVLTSIALRAMAAEVGDDWRPISTNTIFHEAIEDGPLEVWVHVLRRGNVATQLRAALGPAGDDPRMEVQATFVRGRRGPAVVPREYPADLLPAEACEPYWRSRTPLPFFRHLDTRLAYGHRHWVSEWEPGPARCARWFRYRQPPLREGRLAWEAYPPLVDTMPAALFEALGSEHPRMYAPSLDLTVHYLAETRSEWVLAHARAIWAADGWASAEMELWDADRRLLAYGTQTMMLRSLPGERVTSGR